LGSGVLVVVTSSYPNAADGTEAAGSFVADLVLQLSTRVRVRVVAPGTRDELQRISANLDVYRFSAPGRPLSTLRPHIPADAIQIFNVLRAGSKATHSAVAAGEVAHIFALWALPCGFWARSAARRFTVPYSVWTLGSDIWSLGRIPLVRQVLARVLRDAVRCYSDGYLLRDDTQRIARRNVDFLPSTRVVSLANEKQLSTSPPYRLVYIGRWHDNKGTDILVQALSLLDDETWQRISSVEIHGGGPLRPSLEFALEQLGSRSRQITLGDFVDKAVAESILLHADFVMIPSRVESIPVIFSDAMKRLCPVIATPVGDLPALVSEGPVGVVATAVTANAYASAITAAVRTTPAKYEEALRDMAAKFSIEDFVMPKLITELGLGAT